MADLMEFSNRTGAELAQVLAQRAKDELSGVSGNDRFTAMLGAALIATANLLRGPVEKGADVEKVLSFSTRWLRTFLEPAVNQAGESQS
jgi:hypothetical protein